MKASSETASVRVSLELPPATLRWARRVADASKTTPESVLQNLLYWTVRLGE